MNNEANLYNYHNRDVYVCIVLTCICFVLTEYCPELHFLDEIHLKHILLIGDVFLFGVYLLRRKKKLFITEVYQIIICVMLLYGISLFFQIKNDGFKVYSLEEVYYLMAPLLLIWIVYNFVSLKRIPAIVDGMFYASCFCFVIRFGSEFSFRALSEMSFINSTSPFESDLAQFFLLFCIFYLYTKQKKKTVFSAILCFLCFKRFSLIMLIVVLVGFAFIPHHKPVPKWVYLTTIVAFIFAPFAIYYMCTESFASWFYQKFGIDFDLFTMTRFSIINTVIDADLTNYGLGTVTDFLENRGVEGQLNMHNDILRIYMETTLVGSIAFTRQYFHPFKGNMFSFIVIFYAFMELLVAHYIGPGTTSFWLIVYLLVFYFNAFENTPTDEEGAVVSNKFGLHRRKLKFVRCK